MKKKILALILTVIMILSLMPVMPAFAEVYTTADALAILREVVGAQSLTDAQRAKLGFDAGYIPTTADALRVLRVVVGAVPQPGVADFSAKRIIVNTNIENIEDLELDGLKSVEVLNDNTCVLEFYNKNDAESANEVFIEISIFSEADIIVKATETVYIDDFKSWGVLSTGMSDYQDYLKSENNLPTITVAVLDTGVDSSHSMLKGRVVNGWNFVSNNSNTNDGHGHGTHVSGTIAESTLDNVKIMPVKVLDNNGNGYSSDVVSGIRWAADNGADVINLSLGGYGRLQSTRDAIIYANGKGCTVVVSAGNENDNASYYDPAWVPEAITVSAHNKGNQRAYFSNFGDVIDLSAPGVDITSSVPGNKYETWSGTSMSAPHISAAVALLMSDSSYKNLNPDAIQNKIKEATDDLGAPGFDIYYGYGGLNVKKLFSGSEPTDPNPPVTEPNPPITDPNPPVPPPIPGIPVKIGDVIRFGGYDWRVKEIQNGQALLLSESVLIKRQYHSDRKDDVTWENSDIRAWLNGEFYNDTFSAQEKTQIALTTVENKNNQWHGTSGGNNTSDKLFLFSMDELVKYFGDSGQLENKPRSANYINDEYNAARVSYDLNGKVSWLWIRSPGNSNKRAATTNLDGDIDPRGDIVDNRNGGIRPAMWINIS